MVVNPLTASLMQLDSAKLPGSIEDFMARPSWTVTPCVGARPQGLHPQSEGGLQRRSTGVRRLPRSAGVPRDDDGGSGPAGLVGRNG